MTSTEPLKPEGFEPYLGAFGVVLTDANHGEPIAWGWPVTKRMGVERFLALRKKLPVVCSSAGQLLSEWVVIAKALSHDDAVAAHGPVTRIEVGPKGGWRATTYGSRRFMHSRMKMPPDVLAAFTVHAPQLVERDPGKAKR